jgi:CRISPR-associated protein Csx1
MKFIYQIGRFDTNYTKSINFKIDNMSCQCSLSSIALKQYFEQNGHKTKLILVYPVSIIYNENAVKNINDEFVQIIKKNVGSYLDNPKQILNSHPHNKDNDFLVVHSIGKYKLNNIVTFQGTFDDIVLEILCDMVEKYLEIKSELNEFYIDISSGHNIYISALLEALKHFSIFCQLLNWENKNLRPKTYVVFSEPLMSPSTNEAQMYIKESEFKAFFSSPVKKDDIDINNGNRLAKRIYYEDREKRSKIDKILTNFGIVFSAIRNNIPLVLYHFGYDGYDEIVNFLKQNIIEDVKNKMIKNWILSPNLQKDDYIKIILTLGLYAGIVEVLYNIKVNKYEKNEGVELDQIKEKFATNGQSIYEKFNLDLSISLLGQEIHNLSKGKDEDGKKLIDKCSNQWEKLGRYLYGIEEGFNWRNFLAHAGFERTITEVKKENSEIHFRYTSNEEQRIKNEIIYYFQCY